MTMETGRVTVTYGYLAEKFWQSEQGENAKEGMRLDHTAVLPSFLADNVDFKSDEHIAEFYAPHGEYEAIKRVVILTRPPKIEA